MKPIQIVVDSDLLGRLDRAARRKHLSRSAFIRRSLEASLAAEQMRELVEADRRGYSRPASAEEKRQLEGLAKAQARVLARLGREDPW